MQFLHPNILWALFALVVPVIIHLFNFRRYTVVMFSNTAFLQKLQHESKSRSVLRNWLLLVVRMLIYATLVILFAHPYYADNKSVSDIQPRVSVYIDNSFSMDAQGEEGMLLEWAKVKASELTEQFPNNTLFMLTTNNLSPEQQHWVSRDVFIKWLAEVDFCHLTPTVGDVICWQQNVQRDTNAALFSFVFSDLHKPSFVLNNVKQLPKQQFVLVPFVGAARNNVAIDSAWFSNPGMYIGKDEQLTVRLRNYGVSDVENMTLQVAVNDTVRANMPFSVAAGKHIDVSCQFLQQIVGNNYITATITDFPITFDNQLHLSYNVPQSIKVLGVSDKQATDYFKFLYTDKAVDYTNCSLAQSTSKNFADYQLVIINQPKELSVGLAKLLKQYVADGGTLLLIPSKSNVDAEFNALLSSTGGPRLGEWINQKGRVAKPKSDMSLLKNAIRNTADNYATPTYSGYYKTNLSTRQVYTNLLKSESGDALFGVYQYSKGKVYLSALPFEATCTDLVTHQLFVPLLYNVALQSVKQTELYYTIKPNMVISLPMQPLNATAELVSSSGKKLFPTVRRGVNGISILATESEMTSGLWKVNYGNQQAQMALNYNRSESVQQFLSESEALQLFKDNGLSVSQMQANQQLSVSDVVDSDNVWKLFALLAFLLLLIEIAIAKLVS